MAKKNASTYSVIIPVYNSTDSVIELVDRLRTVFAGDIHETFEILLVNDGSSNPEVWPTLHGLATRIPEVGAIQFSRNFGRTHALMAGLRLARGEYMITMDDDLQHRPEDLPQLIAARDHDIVYASFAKRKHTLFQRLASRIKGWFDYKLIGKPRHITISSFMLVKASIVRQTLDIRSPFPFIPGYLFHLTRDVVEVPATHDERKYGKSGFTIRKMMAQFSNLLINNSSYLLQMTSMIGIIVACASMAYGIYAILQRLFGDVGIPGWTSVIVLVSFLGGAILFSLGLVGEYLIRIIFIVEMRPMYNIREQILPEQPGANDK